MHDRILLPLDGSKLAEAVEPHAMAIAKKFESEVILLQVVTPASAPLAGMAPARLMPAATAQIGVEAARAELEAEMKEAAQYLSSVAQRFEADVAVRTHVAEGVTAKMILQSARDADVSMICMSTYGRSGLGRTIFGSVADAVLRNSHLPLLLIRPQPQ